MAGAIGLARGVCKAAIRGVVGAVEFSVIFDSVPIVGAACDVRETGDVREAGDKVAVDAIVAICVDAGAAGACGELDDPDSGCIANGVLNAVGAAVEGCAFLADCEIIGCGSGCVSTNCGADSSAVGCSAFDCSAIVGLAFGCLSAVFVATGRVEGSIGDVQFNDSFAALFGTRRGDLATSGNGSSAAACVIGASGSGSIAGSRVT
jgi:hypothetical protein